MRRRKFRWMAALLVICVLVLTGCGEREKYREAQSLADAGDDAAALEAFRALGSYQDAKAQVKALQKKIADEATAALNEGRFQDAAELAAVGRTRQSETLLSYAQAALAGTCVRDAVYDKGRLSCRIRIADSVADAAVRIRLIAGHGDFEGTAYVESKIGEQTDDEGRFGLEAYRSGGEYVLDAVELSAFPYSSDPRKATVYSTGIFVPESIISMSVMGAYKAVAQDGREGYQPALGLLGAKFLSVEKTFAGGEAAIDILSGKETVFSIALDLPSQEENAQ